MSNLGQYRSIAEHPRFGKICVDLGFISEDQLRTALDEQIQHNRTNKHHINLGKILLSKHWINYEQFLAVLDRAREQEHNVSDFINAIKRDVRVIGLIVLLTALTLGFINLSFTSILITDIPTSSLIVLMIISLALISISFYLSKRITRKSIDELLAYNRKMNSIFESMFQEIEERKKIEDDMRIQSKKDWEGTFNTINDLITVHDMNNNIINANEAAKKMLGLPEEGIDKDVKCYEYFHGIDTPPAECPCHQSLETRLPVSHEMFEPHLNKYVEIRVIPRINVNNDLVGLIHIVRDITDRKRTEDKYHSLVNSTDDSIYLIDRDYRYLFMNKIHQSRLGLTEDAYMNRPYSDFHTPEETMLFTSKADKAFSTGDSVQYEYKSFRDERHILQTFSPVKDPDGEITAMTIISKEITMLKEAEEKLYRMSITDELTGIYNRRGFLTLSAQQLKVANRDHKRLFLMSADLDGLKRINDSLGHERGDAALVNVAEIMKATFRESDIIARIGGDEFIVLGIDTPDTNIKTLVRRLKENLQIHNARIKSPHEKLSLSYGFASYNPARPCTIDELLTEADRLMYSEKSLKRSVNPR